MARYISYTEREAVKEVARNMIAAGYRGGCLSYGQDNTFHATLFMLHDDIKSNLYDIINSFNTYKYGCRCWEGVNVGGHRVPTDIILEHVTVVEGDFTSLTYNRTLTF